MDLIIYRPLPRKIYEATLEVNVGSEPEIFRTLYQCSIPIVLAHFSLPKLLLQLDFTNSKVKIEKVKESLNLLDGVNLKSLVPLNGRQTKSIHKVFIGEERVVLFYANLYEKVLDKAEEMFGRAGFSVFFDLGKTYGHEVFELYVRKMYKGRSNKELLKLLLSNITAAGRGRYKVIEGKNNEFEVFAQDVPLSRVDTMAIELIAGFLEALKKEKRLEVTFSHFDKKIKTYHFKLEPSEYLWPR